MIASSNISIISSLKIEELYFCFLLPMYLIFLIPFFKINYTLVTIQTNFLTNHSVISTCMNINHHCVTKLKICTPVVLPIRYMPLTEQVTNCGIFSSVPWSVKNDSNRQHRY